MKEDSWGDGEGGAAPGGSDPIPPFPDCDETIERLYVYLDGELTEDRRAAIQRHLDLCGHCVEAFDFEAELRRVIANRCRDHVPESLMDRVAAALSRERYLQGN